MKAAGVFVLICIAAALSTAKADGTCERIENYNWWAVGRDMKTCFMKITAIDSKNFSITSNRDESVEGFWAYNNKQLEYLPNNLGAKFSNLVGLSASDCSIKEVSKDNFQGLGSLRHLYLSGNQIEKIDDDTFEYIPAVEWISLWNNKIKKLNGRTFASLHKLTMIGLTNNECIDEVFNNPTRIAEMPRVVTEKCGFSKSEPSPTIIVRPEADLVAQSELQALKIEFSKLEALIELKVQEISNLSNDLQAKTAEINEKNEKIKQCEKKIQILGGYGPL